MNPQTPNIRQELSNPSGRRIWRVTIGVAALLVLAILLFSVIWKQTSREPATQVPTKTETPQR
jgi:hypothetical protein